MRLVQREIRQPRILVVGRVVTRILLGFFFTHSASYAQVSAAQSLKTEITGVRISADRRPILTFKINDGQGRAVELSDLDDGSIRFTIAAIKAEPNGQTSYHNYILTKVTGKEYVYQGEIKKTALAETLQPDLDKGGAIARLRPGVFTYTFKTALPADYDRNATHVIGGELTRDKGKFVANPLYEFVPSGAAGETRRSHAHRHEQIYRPISCRNNLQGRCRHGQVSANACVGRAVLKEPQVKEIVAYVRTLSNGKKETAQVSGAQNK